MAFPKQPVVNVKTSDNTGYIIEFLTQSTMGPGGCVRVTTRDVMKLSAVSQTASEIVPRTQAATMNSFGSSPEVVVISPSQYNDPIRTSCTFNKKTSFNLDSNKHFGTSPPSRSSTDIQTICVAMEDAACGTDDVCKENCTSQTDVVGRCDQACGNDDSDPDRLETSSPDTDNESEGENSDENMDESLDQKRKKVYVKIISQKNCPKSSAGYRENNDSNQKASKTDKDQMISEIKKCRCRKKKSSVDDGALSKSDKDTSMDTDDQARHGKRGVATETEESGPVCKKCRSKSNDESGSQSDTSLKKDKGCGTSDENQRKRGRKSKNTGSKNKLYVCEMCLKENECDHVDCEDLMDVITDIYRNKRFDDSKMNRMPVEVDLSQTMVCTGCTVRNSVSLMNIDISDNYMNASHSETSSREDLSGNNSSSSQSLCASCRAAEKQQKQTDGRDKTDSKLESTEDWSSEGKSKKEGPESKSKQTKRKGKMCLCSLPGEQTESVMSVSDCGTSTGNGMADCSDATQTKNVVQRNKYVQCLSAKFKNACVETNERYLEDDHCSCPTQTDPEEPPPSVSQSIKDFVTRYVWGDPITKESSTQCARASDNEEGRCFVWYLKNGELTPMECEIQRDDKTRPKLKDSFTQMEVDDKNCKQNNRPPPTDNAPASTRKDEPQVNYPLKNILKKSDSDHHDNSKSNITSKRSVIFNPEAVILEKNTEDADAELIVVENPITGENEPDNLFEIDTPEMNEADSCPRQKQEVSSRNNKKKSSKDKDENLLTSLKESPSLTSIESVYFGPDESFDPIENGLVKEGRLVTNPEPQKDKPQTDGHENGKSKSSNRKIGFKKFIMGKNTTKLDDNKT